jgi:carbon-monoxide dehydrogenase large subunit
VTAAVAAVGPQIGRAAPRLEDRALLIGAGRYLDDLAEPGQLCARIVRSPVAYGRIRSVNVERAASAPGVAAVLTGDDIPPVRIPVRMLVSEEAKPVTQPPLAREFVRYVGEPVAVVVAGDPYLAEDAASLVEVSIDPLAPVLDGPFAASPEAPVLHDEAVSGNVINRLLCHHGEHVDELLAQAAVVVRDTMSVDRQSATPLETRGLLARWDADSARLTMWGPTKVKHFNRTILATFLNMEESAIRFVEPDVGGGFGARGEFYPEDFLIPWLAIRLGRPVKWVEDRHESLMAMNHSRQVHCNYELGLSQEGDLLAFRARCIVDQGAYARTHGTLLLPWILTRHIPGPYRWHGFDIEATSVLTNKTPSGTYRGPSQFESAYFRERMVHRGAVALGMDPADLRERNLIRVESLPLKIELGEGHAPITYDGGDFAEVFSAVLEKADYPRLRDRAQTARQAGELVGVGLSVHVEEGAFGRYEYARIVPVSDRRYLAYVGIASLGQGVRTALAQIAAEHLCIPYDWVEVVHHDTDLVPEGFGAYGSRTTVVGGGAVVGAVTDLRDRAIAVASERLEIDPRDLELVDGGIVRPRGQPSGGVPLADLGCEGYCRYEQAVQMFDMGAMLAVVRVDPETAGVTVQRLVVSQDVGRRVNPQMVDGQLVGGAVQGLGGTLLERFAYDESGQPLAASFMDYMLPTAAESPPIDHAVADALGAAGDRVMKVPIGPDQIRAALIADREQETSR